MIKKRKEEQEAFEKNFAAKKNENTDTIEIIEDGKVMLKEHVDSDCDASAETVTDAAKKEPVFYTQAGETILSQSQSGANISVSVWFIGKMAADLWTEYGLFHVTFMGNGIALDKLNFRFPFFMDLAISTIVP